MPRLLQLIGAALVAWFFYQETGPINGLMWVCGVGIGGLNTGVVPSILGVVTFLLLRQGGFFASLPQFLVGVIAAWVPWSRWDAVNDWAWSLGLGRFHPAIAPVCTGLLILATLNIFVVPLLGRASLPSGQGLSTSPVMRRVHGFLTVSAVNLGIVAVCFGLLAAVLPAQFTEFWNAVYNPGMAMGRPSPPYADWTWRLLCLASFLCCASLVSEKVRFGLAASTLPLRRLRHARKAGIGGSERFLGQWDEWLRRWKPGRLFLGMSMYEPKVRLGLADDRHALLVATNRSGKGRSFIVPNLLTWPGSCFVIDPKGENAAITARIRKLRLHQTVHILDPFHQLERQKLPEFWWKHMGQGGQPYRMARYNPLKDLRLNDDDIVTQIDNLGAALVIPAPGANPFWDNASQVIFSGVTAHVLVSPKVRDEDRHFGTVRDYVLGLNGRSMEELKEPVPRDKPQLGGLALAGYNTLKEASDNAGGDIKLTLKIHMAWLADDAIRDSMTASDFSLNNLKENDTSIYLVIPSDYLERHACYMRLVITMALRAAGRGAKAAHPMLFLLDEFAALGRLDVVATAAGLLSGYGVKLCPVVQNLTQLRIYGEKWEVFLSNAGQQQVFAVNDKATADYYSDRLGSHMTMQRKGAEWVPAGISSLRSKGEMQRESSRESGQALVFMEGSEVMLVKRGNYDRQFKEYDWNPYENTARAKRRRWISEWQYGAWEDFLSVLSSLWRKLEGLRRKPAAGSPP